MKNTLNTKWAIDTNIIVYFLDKNSVFHIEAKNIILSLKQNKQSIYIAHQNIIELIGVLTSFYKLSLAKAVSTAKAFISQKEVVVVYPQLTTLTHYFTLCANHTRKVKDHFDLYLASTLLDNQTTHLVTNDFKGFKTVETLKIVKFSEKTAD